MENDYMLTTFDNEFNPFTQFDAWFKEDMRLGHYTCQLLDKMSFTADDVMSDELNEAEIDRAMDEIVENYPLIYKKVKKDDYK